MDDIKTQLLVDSANSFIDRLNILDFDSLTERDKTEVEKVLESTFSKILDFLYFDRLLS